jgi:hypothetical protein
MSALDRGCDYAACKATATTSAGGWSFCDKHAEDDRRLREGEDVTGEPLDEALLPPVATGHGTEARARQHARDGEQPCTACAAAAARAAQDRRDPRRAPMTSPTTSPLGALLEQASGHGNTRVRKLAGRIETQLDELRARIAEDAAKETARQEVARLEQQLAAAKARLRNGAASSTATAPAVDGRTAPLPCRKGCGKISTGGQGRAAHERNCTHVAAAS